MIKDFSVSKTEEQWKKELNPQAYHVLRKKGTEPPFQNEFNDHKEQGIYYCGGCDEPLFHWKTKYSSGSGWPSFFEPINQKNIGTTRDRSLMMERVEVHCNKCGGHLGHVFTDGPAPTGLRYCINSAALKFKPEKNSDEQ